MTKHLRLIMLSLLAMICLGGYSQSKGPEVTLDFSDYKGNPWDISTSSYCKETKTYTNGTYSIILTPGEEKGVMLSNYKGTGYLQMGKKNASITLPAFNFDVEKIVVVAPPSGQGNKSVTQNVYVDKVAVSTQTTGCQSNKEYQINEEYQKSGNRYVIKVTNGYLTYMSKIQIYKKKGDNRQDAGIRFAKDSYNADITGSTFNEAELVNPNGLEVAYEITPKTEGVSIAKDGTVTYPAVEATYTVTAKFAGNNTYKPATATYTLNVVDPNAVVFEADKDKGTTTGQEADEMSKNGVTIQSTSAALGNGSNYRFYGGSTNTFSVKRGFITKIVFEGNNTGDKYLLTYVGLQDKDNGVFNAENSKATWEGEAKSVVFKTTAQARATKITVTVKLPVAKDYTLDEEDVNVIEDYDNANVTLKRTFYHDNAWNTLCLPFDVDANKVATAFAGAEIREIDLSQCKDNTIQFVPATEIKAGVPYIIKWNENVADAQTFEKTFERVTLVAEPKPVKVNNDITFTGFYKMTAASELGGTSVAAIGAGSKLFTVGEGKMKGFRAAFVLSSNAQASKYKVVIDGTATGIEDLVIDSAKANGRVYNLNGQYVGNSLNGLLPGLYIQNGKKIVVK